MINASVDHAALGILLCALGMVGRPRAAPAGPEPNPPRHAEMTPGLMTSFSTDILLNMTARQVVTAVRLYRRTHLDLMRSVSTACRRG